MSDKDWLENVIHNEFVECGKSGRFYYKNDTIEMLLSCDEDRDILVYNYCYQQISSDVYMVHYITKSLDDLIYRTSIWVDDNGLKLRFHQASILKEKVDLILC